MLKTTSELVFIDVNKGTSQKTGKPYCFVKFANPQTFENFTVSAVEDGFYSDDINSGERVHAEFNVSDRFGNAALSVKKMTKAKIA